MSTTPNLARILQIIKQHWKHRWTQTNTSRVLQLQHPTRTKPSPNTQSKYTKPPTWYYKIETSTYWENIDGASDTASPPLRKMVKVWAEKAQLSPHRCPKPIALKANALVMQFLWTNECPSPTCRRAELGKPTSKPLPSLDACFTDVNCCMGICRNTISSGTTIKCL